MLNLDYWNNGNTGKPGVQIYIDTQRYTDGANQLLSNQPLDNKQIQYFGYITVIAIVQAFGGSLFVVTMLQLFFALFSAWFLFDLARTIAHSRLAGLLAVGFYLANPFTTVWHFYILTESLYTSLLIISVWFIVKFMQFKTIKWFILTFLMLIMCISIRPNGLILLPLLAILYIVYSNLKTYQKITSIVFINLLFVIGVSIIPSINQSIETVGDDKIPIQQVLQRGEIIWGHHELYLNMPKYSENQDNWTNSVFYILKHPVACSQLALYRVASEVFQIFRPWYSTKYQLRMNLWLYPAYIFAVLSLFYYRKYPAVQIVLLVIIAHLLIVALTYADHEHRFLNYYLPLIYVLSSCGAIILLQKLRLKLLKNSFDTYK